MNSFHVGGYDAYCRALREERDERLRALQSALAEAETTSEKARLRADLRTVRSQYEERIAAASRALF